MDQQTNPFSNQSPNPNSEIKQVKQGLNNSALLKFLAITTVIVILFILLRKPITERLSPSELPATGTQTQAQEGAEESKTITERITESITGKTVTYSPTIQVAGDVYYTKTDEDNWVNNTGDTMTGDLALSDADILIDENNIATSNAIISSKELDILDDGITADEIEGLSVSGGIDAYQNLLDEGRLNNSADSDILTRGQGDTRFLLANGSDTYLAGNTLTFNGNTDFNGDLIVSDQNVVYDAPDFTLFYFTGNLGVLASGESDDYIMFSSSNDSAQLLWDGYTTNKPGFRVNTSSNRLEYRDENESGWTALDNLGGSSLWTDGGTYLYPTGNEDIRLANGNWIGSGNAANQPYLTFDDSNDQIEFIGGNVGIGTNNPISTLDVFNFQTISSGVLHNTGYFYDLWDGTITSSSTVNGVSIYSNSDITGSALNNLTHNGLKIQTQTSTSSRGFTYGINNRTIASDDVNQLDYLYGMDNLTYNEGNGTINYGYSIQTTYSEYAGTTNNAYGVKSNIATDDGSIGTAYGLHSQLLITGTGSITTGYSAYMDCNDADTCYGIYIAAGDAEVTTDWGVYVTGEDTNYFSGDVGIGITNPGQELEVNGDIRLDANGSATTNGLCHSGANSDTTFADRDIVACSGAPADVAEWYDTKDGKPGDIVSTTGETVTYSSPAVNALTGEILNKKETLTASVLAKTTHPYQSNILGVISTSPYETFGRGIIDYAQNPNPIALTGRALVNVSTQNGKIQPGDPITTSTTPGVGMKATEPGVIIGRALDYYSNTNKIGKILLFVNISWFEPSDFRDTLVALLGAYNQGIIGSLDTKTSIELSALTQTVQNGVFGSITIDNVHVTQNLQVDGVLSSRQIRTDLLSAKSNQDIIVQLSEQIGSTSLIIENSLGQRVFSIDSTGKLSIISDTNSASVGSSFIPSGQTEVIIQTSAVTTDSKIFVTPRSNIGDSPLYVDEVTSGIFKVKVSRAKNIDITFDWWVIN